MNFKKTMSCVLSAAMMFTSLAFYNPVKADTNVYDQYFNDMQKVMDWKEIKSDSTIQTKVDIKENDSNMSFGYDVKVNSNYDKEQLRGELKLSFKEKGSLTPKIPNIHIYYDSQNLYLSKESAKYFFDMLNIDKDITKEYVKINLNTNSSMPAALTLNEQFLKNYSQNSTQISEKLIKFMKGINLGVDIGLTKNGNTYSINWDADKSIDILNAYVKYIFSNPKVFMEFYKDVFSIDMNEMYKSMNVDINVAMKESLDMWNKEVEPMLSEFKKVLKGSNIILKETYGENDYKAELILKLNADISKAQKLFDKSLKADKSKTGESLSVFFKTNQYSVNKLDKKLEFPSDYQEFDFEKYFSDIPTNVQPAKKTEEIAKPSNKKQSKNFVDKIKISPSKKRLVVMKVDKEISKSSIDCKIEKGKLYVSQAQLKKHLNIKPISDEKYAIFKDLMSENGYETSWDSKQHEGIATK